MLMEDINGEEAILYQVGHGVLRDTLSRARNATKR